jgi:hypothetical protein
MSVIRHDFSKKKGQAVRRFRRLLSLDAVHEANVRANPVAYLERASERIFQLERALFEAAEAVKPPFGQEATCESISVDKAHYQRLLASQAIIDKALAACRADDEKI